MPAHSSFHSGTAEPLPSLGSLGQWILDTYRAPFRDPPDTVQDVRDLERFRRFALLRIVTFSVTLVLLTISLPAVVLLLANDLALTTLLLLILAGVVTLFCNERGWITGAGAIYLYSFLLTTYLYVIFSPSGVDAIAVACYGLVNALLFLGGLTFSQQALLPNCVAVIVVTSVNLLLTPRDHATALGTTP